MSQRHLTILPVPARGAEDVLVDDRGRALTGTADGSVFRVSHDGDLIERVGRTGGRPLGLEWLPDGRVLVCDAHRGLLALQLDSGEVETIVDRVDGTPMRFCNNAAVAADGTMWFSDSSRRFGVEDWKADLIEDTRSGRLLRRDPDGAVAVALGGLGFANGVALAADGAFVAVAETAYRQLVRLWLTGPKTGQQDRFVEDLPGYPDNISRGSDGLIWVTYASPVDPVLAGLQRLGGRAASLRSLARALPNALQPSPKRTVRVAAYDSSGALVHDISLDATCWHMATGVREQHGTVWLGSLVEPAIARFQL